MLQSSSFGSSDHGKDQSMYRLSSCQQTQLALCMWAMEEARHMVMLLQEFLSLPATSVQKEYYINDAGRQIDILTASVFIRIFEEEFLGYFPQKMPTRVHTYLI